MQYDSFMHAFSVLTQSSYYQCLHPQSQSLQVFLYGPGRLAHTFIIFSILTSRKMKPYVHYMPYNHWPEQYHVSWRAPTGRNEGPQCGQSHVDFEYAITVTLPGALTQRCGHVHAGSHHLANAGTVMKHLTNQDTGMWIITCDSQLSCFHRMIFEEFGLHSWCTN